MVQNIHVRFIKPGVDPAQKEILPNIFSFWKKASVNFVDVYFLGGKPEPFF